MYKIHYTTQSKRTLFSFISNEENGRWHAYALQTPFLGDKLKCGEMPPGCDRFTDMGYHINWFNMTPITSLEQCNALAAFWAEDIEKFLDSGKWRVNYPTNDGCDVFSFSIERKRGDLRVYIVSHPPYKGRDDSSHATHRLSDGRRKYICWTDDIDTWAQAENIATFWAEKTQQYIRTGSFQ